MGSPAVGSPAVGSPAVGSPAVGSPAVGSHEAKRGINHGSNLELLCPAGSSVALHAAVRGGADAVYLGGAEFNARRGAGNFSEKELRQAVHYAHLRGVRVYLTFNIAVFESEMPRAMAFARKAAAAGIDAFIVQDVGVWQMLANQILPEFPQVRLHASTQMNIHSADGLRFAAHLGAARVTLARELSVEEISELCALGRELGVEVEVFGHGALCVCYSGQCLMSSMIGGRSANRGTCAQACRLEYELCRGAAPNLAKIDSHVSAKAPVTEMADYPSKYYDSTKKTCAAVKCRPSANQKMESANNKQYLLSPKDLCSIDVLPQLAAAGVASLKIEGRMKSPEYVNSVARVYREAIDNACRAAGAAASDKPASDKPASDKPASDKPSGNLSPQVEPCDKNGNLSHQIEGTISSKNNSAKKQLAQVFSRGFTTAYLTGERDNAIMGYQRPNNRGVKIGRVTGVSKAHLSIDTAEKMTPGDVIEIWTSKGRAAIRVDKNFDCNARHKGEGARKSSKNNTKHQSKTASHTLNAKLDMTKGELRGVRKGDRVFRVRSAEDEFIDSELEPRVAVEGEILLHIGQPLTLRVWAKNSPGLVVEILGENVEQARTRAVSKADIKEHVCRTGQTPFEISALKVELDDNVGIEFSALHHLRAETLDKLERKLIDNWQIALSCLCDQLPTQYIINNVGAGCTSEAKQV